MSESVADERAEQRLGDLVEAGELAPPAPTGAQVRTWAGTQGIEVSDRGRVPKSVLAAYEAAQQR